MFFFENRELKANVSKRADRPAGIIEEYALRFGGVKFSDVRFYVATTYDFRLGTYDYFSYLCTKPGDEQFCRFCKEVSPGPVR